VVHKNSLSRLKKCKAIVSEEVLVIGGGFAGLAAGAALAEAGVRVRLLEANPYLGGRARSWVDPLTNSVVDNGQHLFMGCYHATVRFLSTIGTLDRIRFQTGLTLRFLEYGGRLTSLECPSLPAPFHLLAGVARSDSFSRHEKLEMLRLGWALQSIRGKEDDLGSLTVDEWLRQLGQSNRLRRNFWDLLCIAVMNEDPKIASAALFERVLRLALFRSSQDSRLGIAGVGLSDCYTRAAVDYIRARGGQVDLNHPVQSLLIEGDKCRGIELGTGERVRAHAVICAIPWFALGEILPRELAQSHSFFARIPSLRPAPILSVNVWFDRPVTELDFAGLRGSTIQWLFNKGRIFGGGQNYVSLVVSGAHQHVACPKEELLALALRELAEFLPVVRKARILRSLVIKERWATFSPSCEAEALRPPARTPVKGLYLAGDWTATGLPATIEGAVRSGYAAAEASQSSNLRNPQR
jgi:squalene-associated FAD-dependent desaturase